jgi:hypothetical protein
MNRRQIILSGKKSAIQQFGGERNGPERQLKGRLRKHHCWPGSRHLNGTRRPIFGQLLSNGWREQVLRGEKTTLLLPEVILTGQ